MNTPNKIDSSPIEEKREQGYTITIGHERIRVISVFIGTKSASKAIYDAAVKKFFTMLKKICRGTANIVMSIFSACCRKLS